MTRKHKWLFIFKFYVSNIYKSRKIITPQHFHNTFTVNLKY